MSSVVDILRARAARGSRAPHADGASIALCVEGGAMRGVVSAGMVRALEELGLTHAFDAVYGSSAGALNAAYFLAGQARLGTTIYYEDINTRHFIDFLRPLRGRAIVDLGYFMDDVVVRRKPLDVDRVLQSLSPLSVLATDVDTGEACVFRDFAGRADLLGALRAGSTMPVIAGDPWHVRGRRYWDASLSQPIPLPAAETGGHSHIVVLLTRPGLSPGELSAFDRWYVLPRLARVLPALAARYRTRMGPYATLLERIATGKSHDGRAIIEAIRPDGPTVSKLERRREVLMQGAEQGRRAVFVAFGGITFPASPRSSGSR